MRVLTSLFAFLFALSVHAVGLLSATVLSLLRIVLPAEFIVSRFAGCAAVMGRDRDLIISSRTGSSWKYGVLLAIITASGSVIAQPDSAPTTGEVVNEQPRLLLPDSAVRPSNPAQSGTSTVRAATGAEGISFEGLADQESVLNYYNGGSGGSGSGPGPNYGVTFSSNALGIISRLSGGNGNFANTPSGKTILFFMSGSSAVLNFAQGFSNGFSFYYSAASAPGFVRVYSGLAGTGTVLAELALPVTPSTGATGYSYDNWQAIGVSFIGVAKSVDFGGSANKIGFDNITIGNFIAEGVKATLVSETIPIGTPITAGQSFTKTWTIKNSGTTTWDSTIQLKWVSGASLSNHSNIPVSGTVAPGASTTFSAAMTAPTSTGTYREDWKLVGSSGTTIPVSGSNTVWASIVVANNAALGGKVLDAKTLQPLSGAAVLVGTSGATTNGTGDYLASGLASGTYTLSVSKTGYDTWSGSITLSPNASTLKNVVLTIKPATAGTGPRIVSLTSKYSKSTGSTYYFLPGVGFNVEFTAQVDWNGKPPGKVRFITSQGNVDVVTGNTIASTTIDVGTMFSACATLKAIAIDADGIQSEAKDADFVVTKPLPVDVAFPGLSNNLAVVHSSESFSYKNNGTLNKDVLGETLGNYRHMPILGGAAKASVLKFVPAFDFEFDGKEGKSSYQLSLLKNSELASMVKEKYTHRQEPNGLKNLNKALDAWVKSGEVPQNQLPSAKIANFELLLFPQLKVESTFRCGTPVNAWGQTIGSLGLAGSGEWSVFWKGIIAPTIPIPWYAKGTLGLEFDILGSIDGDLKPGLDIDGKPYIKATIGAGVNDVIGIEGTGKGGVDLKLHVPAATGQSLLSCKAYLYVTCRAYMFAFESQCDTEQLDLDCTDNAAGGSSTVQTSLSSNASPAATMSLISRDYLAADKSGAFQSAPSYRVKQFAADGRAYSVASSPIVSATFPVSAANLSSAGSHVNLLWLADQPTRSAINRTMAVHSSFDGTSWSTPVAIADNGTADFNPVALTLADGAIVAAWEEVKTVLPDTATLDVMAGQLEIAAAVYDPVAHTWGAAVRLTNNATLERTPRLAGKSKTQLMLTWIANAQNDISGSVAHPNALYYALYNGSTWSAPALAATIPNQIKRYNLVYDGTTANVVLALDTDDNSSTLEDLELYRLTYTGGTWGALTRLTTDTIIDDNPQLALDSSNNVVMTWLKGAELSSVVNFDFSKRTIIRSDEAYSSSLADFKQATTGDGKVALIYPDRSENHTADLFGVFYDPVFKLWGGPKQLTDDADTEQWPSIAFLGSDTLISTYNRKLLINPDGTPTTGALTDLYMLKHTLGDDLGLEAGSLTVDPSNAAPGTLVNLSVNALNLGDHSAQNVAVTFYNGNPASGGTQIGTATIGGPFKPGDIQTVSVPWTIPAGSAPLTVYAVVDPASTIDTLNRSNNAISSPLALPDLTIQSVTRERLGTNRYSLLISVANMGGTASAATQVKLHSGSETGAVIATLNVPALARFASVDLAYDWDTSAIAQSSSALVAIVDEANTVQESNEFNNSYTVTFSLGSSSTTYSLTVNSIGAASASIGASPSTYAGTTNYSKTDIVVGTSISLTAPAIVGGVNFNSWSGCDSVSGVICAVTVNVSRSVTASYSGAALTAQSIAFGIAPSVKVGGAGTVSATATSGLAVTFSSLTTGVCTVSGNTVSGVAVGTCSIAANQAGNTTYSAAPQVTQTISVGVPPGPPTISSITAGSGSATIYFLAPSNTGGSAISSYTATCTASGQTSRSASGSTSPLTVKNLTGGVLYQCSLTATSSHGLTSSASATLPVTPAPGKKNSLTPILMLLLD
jgi:hypothetical protein